MTTSSRARRWGPALLALLLVWSPATPAAPPATAPALVAFRRAAAKHLSPAELRRLLARPEVREAVARAMEGYDPATDALHVRLAGDDLTLRVVRRALVRRCAPAPEGAEAGSPEPRCEDVTEPVADRSIQLDRSLWRPPRAAPPRPAPEPPSPPGPPPRSVLRDAAPRQHAAFDALERLPPPLARALADYAELRATLRSRGHWVDPLLADDPLARPPVDERPGPAPAPEPSRAEQNLADPFGPGRMQTALPVPDLLAQGAHAAATRELTVAAPDLACLERWAAAEDHPHPPRLACFQAALRAPRVARSNTYRIARLLGSFVPLPILFDLMEREVKAAKRHTSDTTVWATVWLAWARRNPDRLPAALAALALAERKPLSRHLRRWWGDPRRRADEPTLTRIFEAHFLALYPEAADPAGLPNRRAFADAWLWATNWLAEVDRRGAPSLQATLSALPPADRALVEAILGDPGYGRRFPRLAAALPSRAP